MSLLADLAEELGVHPGELVVGDLQGPEEPQVLASHASLPNLPPFNCRASWFYNRSEPSYGVQ